MALDQFLRRSCGQRLAWVITSTFRPVDAAVSDPRFLVED
jgi:hypothetical protein